MPIPDEHSRPTGGTVYGSTGPRLRTLLPQDRVMLVALAVGVVGVLLGLLLAAGALFGDSGSSAPASPAATATTTADGTAAGADAPAPTPTEVAESSSPPTSGQVFRSVSSSLCLDIVGTEEPEGADAQQANCTDAPSQRWISTPAGDGVVTIVNAASGKCLDVHEKGEHDGATVQQWSCNGGTNQQWRLTDSGGGNVALVSVNSGKCLDVPDSDTTPGAKLHQWTCTGSANQLWTTA
ncbi:hypothetical protein GCM10027290_07380 [Micromonospora sonneratiae]|uniref:RICIN domain-containing protein n=1 Tax=Micromonospora sonneratiae TaxID=1184706 RepID=A0ABW3YDF1_9ACTN